MSSVKFGLFALVSIALCGLAHAQTSPEMPSYEKAYASVMEAACERSEAQSFIRFTCDASGLLWYFTRPGQPAYPAYVVGPAAKTLGLLRSGGGPLSHDSRELAQASVEARRAWLRAIALAWETDAANVSEPPQRHREWLFQTGQDLVSFAGVERLGWPAFFINRPAHARTGSS